MTTTKWELEPVDHPGSTHLSDAIQKGLGRALMWAQKGFWSEKGILLDACQRDLRYDRQCEESRGPWLWKLMKAVGVTNEFHEAILGCVPTINDGLEGQQLCQFCVYYAREGDERFRDCLKEIVTRKPNASYPSLGEEELIDLDGESGFLFAARFRSESLSSREWDWEDGNLIEDAITKFGETTVLTLLERESYHSPAMQRFHDEWHAAVQRRTGEPRQKHADRMRQYSLNDIIQAVECERNQPGILRGWGMYADEADLRALLDRLLNTQDSAALANYLRVFSNRPMPEINETVLRLLDHEDDNVRTRAYRALSKNTHPLIRRFAVDHLNERVAEPSFLELFIRNYRKGDEGQLLEVLRMPEDVFQSHGLLMDLRKILENNPESNCQELATLIYHLTPCSSCRHNAAKLLINHNVAPIWLAEECRFDAVSDTRALVGESSMEM